MVAIDDGLGVDLHVLPMAVHPFRQLAVLVLTGPYVIIARVKRQSLAVFLVSVRVPQLAVQ